MMGDLTTLKLFRVPSGAGSALCVSCCVSAAPGVSNRAKRSVFSHQRVLSFTDVRLLGAVALDFCQNWSLSKIHGGVPLAVAPELKERGGYG